MSLIDLLLKFMFYSVISLPWVFPLSMLLLTWLTPKAVIERFVRPPYFSEFEALAYRYFPSSWIRTLLFSFVISIPFLRKIRGLGDMHLHVPLWFNYACRLFVYGVIGAMMLFILLLFALPTLKIGGFITGN